MITKYRTIWLSDLHLGSKGCEADILLEFLKKTESEYLILNGDIIDGWALKRSFYWPTTHNTIIQKILKKARHGTKVILIVGNHDEFLIDYIGITIGDIKLCREFTHELVGGNRILCVHGDQFDIVTRYHKWVAKIGDIGYEMLLYLNRQTNKLRKFLGFGHWSLSSYIKHKVKEAVQFISDYEESVVHEMNILNVDAISVGHIHQPALYKINDKIYANSGCFVEICSSVVEDYEGNLILLQYENGKFVERIKLPY